MLIKQLKFFIFLPPQDAGQKQQFSRGSDNSHVLELSGSDERLCGRVVYVIVKCGVQGLIYPIKTDVEQNGMQYAHSRYTGWSN